MAINKNKKNQLLEKYNELIDKSQAIYFIDSQNTKTEDILTFKNSLKQLNCTYKLIKNTIFSKAVEAKSYSIDMSKFKGYTAAIFCFEDPVSVAKELSKFLDTNKQVSIKFGLLDKNEISINEIKQLSTIPSRSQLLQQIHGILSNGMIRLITGLNSPITQFTYLVSQIKQNP